MGKDYIIEQLKKQIAGVEMNTQIEKVGNVLEVGDGVVRTDGLSEVMASEMLSFEDGSVGVALNLEEDQVGAMVLGEYKGIKEGQVVKSTGKILSIPVTDKMIGRVINPLGVAIDGKEDITSDTLYPIERMAPGVIERKAVSDPVQTGIKSIDSMIPIGRGQRELIIGDRQVGKTAIAVDTIINQKGQNMVCIYVAIGQKESKVARIQGELEKAGAMEHTIIITAGASESAAFSFIAPYAGAAISEYFMDQGRDVLIVYDDLSKHAWAYRQISLILKRPPGREAYPGDIFYLHSRLLERAAKRDEKYGGGSVTALPIIETQAGDVSAYIPTNVISITDGQIYLESDLFNKGIRPALNVGLSVSRVGSAAQTKAMKKVSGQLRLDLAQFRELEAFAQFGSDLDEQTRNQIARGQRTVELLKQKQYSPMSMEQQVIVLYALTKGFLDDVDVNKVLRWESEFITYMELTHKDILDTIVGSGKLEDSTVDRLEKAIKDFKDTLSE